MCEFSSVVDARRSGADVAGAGRFRPDGEITLHHSAHRIG